MQLTIVALAATALLLTPIIVSAKSDKSWTVAQNDFDPEKEEERNPSAAAEGTVDLLKSLSASGPAPIVPLPRR